MHWTRKGVSVKIYFPKNSGPHSDKGVLWEICCCYCCGISLISGICQHKNNWIFRMKLSMMFVQQSSSLRQGVGGWAQLELFSTLWQTFGQQNAQKSSSEATDIDSEQRITFFIADIVTFTFYYLLLSTSTQTAISTLWQPGPSYRRGESLDISYET